MLSEAPSKTGEAKHPHLWWFDFAHHPESVEGRYFQLVL